MKRPLLSLLLLILLGILGGGTWLLATENGNQRLLQWTLGDRLRIEHYAGTLLRGLDLQGVAYRDGPLQLTIDSLRLRWEPAALFSGLLHIRQLQASGIGYRAAGGDDTAADSAPPTLPLALRLDQVELQGLHIETGADPQSVQRIALSASTQGNRVQIDRFEVDYADYRAETEGQIALAPNYPLQLKIHWQGELPEIGPARGSGEISGDLLRLVIVHDLETPYSISTRGHADLAGEEPVLDLDSRWQSLAWPMTESAVLSDGGHIRLSGPLQKLQVGGNTRLRFPDTGTPPFDVQVATRLSGSGLDDLTLEVRELREGTLPPLELRVGGAIALTDGTPQLDLRGNWSHARWPLLSEAFSASPDGRFQLRGPATQPQLESQAELTFPQGHAPTIQARLQGRLSATGLAGLILDANLLDGTLHTTGDLAWSPAVTWELAVSGESLNPAVQWPEWPGSLALQAMLQGDITAQGPRLVAELRQLRGTLQQQPLTGSGHARYDHTGLDLQTLALRSGPNEIRLHGRLGDRLDLQYELQAPDLAAFWPALQGAVSAEGRLAGTREQPQLRTRLQARKLSYAQQRIGQLDADLDWQQGQARGQLAATQLQSGEWQGRRLTLNLTGTPEAHRAQLELDAIDLRLTTLLQGGWTSPLWRGHLEQLAIDQSRLGRWSLSEPAALLAGADRFSLAQTCLRQDQARLCTSAAWSPDDSRIDANLSRIPLPRLLYWLPAEVAVDGNIDGELHLTGTFPALTGDTRLTLPQGDLRLETPGEQPLQLALRDGVVSLHMGPEGNQATFALSAAGGEIAADARTAPFTTEGPLAVTGNLRAQLPDLRPLGLLLPGLSDIRGRLAAQAKIGGHLGQPQIEGEVTLNDGAANLPQLGLALEGIQLNARNRGRERLALEGQLSSGGGTLGLQGELQLDPAQGWPLSLKLQGEEVQVVRLPEAVAYASPNLDIQLQNRQLTIQGNLKLPRADIQLRELPDSAVGVSEDEVIVGGSSPPAKAPPLDMAVRVAVQIGEQVHFSGFGLETRVQGLVGLNSREGRTLAQGELNLKEGRYRAYGQDLTIEQGRLLFNGPPQNPTLDIRATRLSKDRSVTAVLNVNGNLRNPLVQVSSNPSLPEEEALAYLVTGQGLSAEGPGGAALLRQAAAAKGLEKSQEILNRVASGLGMDEVRFEEGETLEDTALLLGKYLSPDLYVSYAVGLFDNRGALVTRYRLSERLRLEVQSGSSQSMDLIYDVER